MCVCVCVCVCREKGVCVGGWGGGVVCFLQVHPDHSVCMLLHAVFEIIFHLCVT